MWLHVCDDSVTQLAMLGIVLISSAFVIYGFMYIMWFVTACSFIWYLVWKFALQLSFGWWKIEELKIIKRNSFCFIGRHLKYRRWGKQFSALKALHAACSKCVLGAFLIPGQNQIFWTNSFNNLNKSILDKYIWSAVHFRFLGSTKSSGFLAEVQLADRGTPPDQWLLFSFCHLTGALAFDKELEEEVDEELDKEMDKEVDEEVDEEVELDEEATNQSFLSTMTFPPLLRVFNPNEDLKVVLLVVVGEFKKGHNKFWKF